MPRPYKIQSIEDAKLKFTHVCLVGLTFDDKELTADEWLEEAKRLTKGYNFVGSARNWAIGDFVIASGRKFGSISYQLCDIFGITILTLKSKIVHTCRNVSKEVRNPNVPFEHHSCVASFPASEQTSILDKIELGLFDRQTGKHFPLNLRETRALASWLKSHRGTYPGIGVEKLLDKWEGSATPSLPFSFSFRPVRAGESPEGWSDECEKTFIAIQRSYLAAATNFSTPPGKRQRRDRVWGVGRLNHPILAEKSR